MKMLNKISVRNPENVTVLTKESIAEINRDIKNGQHGTSSKYLNSKIGSKINIDPKDYDLKPRESEFQITSAEPKLIRLKNAYINWPMFVFDENKKLVQENLNTYWEWDDGMVPTEIFKSNKINYLLKILGNLITKEKKFLIKKKIAFKKYSKKVFKEPNKIIEVDQAIIFSDQYWYVFGHFISEHYPRLYFALSKLSKEERKQYKIILPPKQNYHYPERTSFHYNYIEPILRALEIDESQRIYLEENTLLKVKDLILPSPIRYHPLVKESLLHVEKYYDDGRSYPEYEKIYISRKRAPRRKIVNENEVEDFLKNRGFKIVTIEDHDFKTQINILKNAKILIAQDSSSLTNVILCHNCIKCLVLTCDKVTCPFFSTIIDAKFYYQFCEPEDRANFDWYSSNIVVDIKKLEENLKELEN